MEKVFDIEEHKEKSIKEWLEYLGYLDLSENYLAFDDRKSPKSKLSKAIQLFHSRNREQLDFLGVEVDQLAVKLKASGRSGIIPIEYAKETHDRAALIVKPMISSKIFSRFVGIAENKDWIEVKNDWAVPKVLDLELWQFSIPFLKEAVTVLQRPAKGFKFIEEVEAAPRGMTDWTNYATQQYPNKQLRFKNKITISTQNVLPHSLIVWTFQAIEESIINVHEVPQKIRTLLRTARALLNPDIDIITPTWTNLRQLSQSGAWSGYKRLFIELERLALLSGVLHGDKENYGCAYAIRSERLFEEFVMHISKDIANSKGFSFYRDTDHSSRIGLNKASDEEAGFATLNSFLPDVVLTNQDTQIIIDAKYKRHFDLSSQSPWEKEADWYKTMRHDLHQVVSYSIFSDKKYSVLLLTHPRIFSDLPYVIKRNSRNKNILIGYLPISFKEENDDIENIIAEYRKNLEEILELLK